MTGPNYFPRPPRPPGKSQPAPTFHTFTRWLTPWRTIGRLEAENQRLQEQAVLRAAINQELSILAESRRLKIEALAGPAYRLRKCPTHGQQPPNAWGCPECVRELRGELATAREALRRLSQWAGLPFAKGWDAKVAFDVADWILSGMTGPLPPLPDHMVNYQLTTTEDQLTTEDQP
jgi:hypothetical protein